MSELHSRGVRVSASMFCYTLDYQARLVVPVPPGRAANQEVFVLRIGSSIFLIALGAILAFAVSASIFPYFDLHMIGYILMAAGIIGLVVSLVMNAPRRTRRVTESRVVVDPATGERIVHNESRDSAL